MATHVGEAISSLVVLLFAHPKYDEFGVPDTQNKRVKISDDIYLPVVIIVLNVLEKAFIYAESNDNFIPF